MIRKLKPIGKGSGPWKHGYSSCNEYRIYHDIKRRCFDKNNSAYKNYGGRGITMCERWKKSVIFFIEDVGSRPSKKHSIDRIDNNGNYSPKNCRWALRKIQNRNSRQCKMITILGHTLPLWRWLELKNLRRCTYEDRIKNGWTPAEALWTKGRKDLIPLRGGFSSLLCNS